VTTVCAANAVLRTPSGLEIRSPTLEHLQGQVLKVEIGRGERI
jgi:hypothetical protein